MHCLQRAREVGYDGDVLDAGDVVERVEPAIDAGAERLQLGRRNPGTGCTLDGAESLVEQRLGLLRGPGDKIATVDLVLDLADQLLGVGDRLARHLGARDRVGRCRRRERSDHGARGGDAGHDDHPCQPEPAATPRLALVGPRDGARVRRPPMWDEGEDDVDEAEQAPARGGLQRVDRRAGAVQQPTDRVRERDRALIGQAGEWLGGADRLELAGRGGGRHLGDLDDEQPIGTGAATDREQLLKMLGGGGGPHRVECPLQLVDAHHMSEVAADQRDMVARGKLALPGVRLDLERLAERAGDAALPDARVLVGHRGRRRQLVHPAAPDHDRAGRPELGHVELAPADGDGHDAHTTALPDPELAPVVVEPPVRRLDCLRERAERAHGQVVVVVALDLVERLLCRAAE